MREWLAPFYERHAALYARELGPHIRMHCLLMDSEQDPDAITRDLVTAYVAESQRQLGVLLDAEPANLAAGLEGLLAQWEIERVPQIADAIMGEELAHG